MIDNSDVTDGDTPHDDEGAGAMPSWMRAPAAPDALAPEDDFGQCDIAADAAATDPEEEAVGAAPPDEGPPDEGPGDEPDPDDAMESEAEDASATAADESGEIVVVLPSRARLPQAEDLTERLRAAIGADSLVIDAREVEEITTPVITAIISALRTRADITPPASVLAPTAAFVDAFSDLGLFQDLMKMEFRQ